MTLPLIRLDSARLPPTIKPSSALSTARTGAPCMRSPRSSPMRSSPGLLQPRRDERDCRMHGQQLGVRYGGESESVRSGITSSTFLPRVFPRWTAFCWVIWT